jgi:hypothetical protein
VKLKLKAGDHVTVNLPGAQFHGQAFEFVRYNGRHRFAIVRATKRFDDYSKGDELRFTGTLLAALERGA